MAGKRGRAGEKRRSDISVIDTSRCCHLDTRLGVLHTGICMYINKNLARKSVDICTFHWAFFFPLFFLTTFLLALNAANSSGLANSLSLIYNESDIRPSTTVSTTRHFSSSHRTSIFFNSS